MEQRIIDDKDFCHRCWSREIFSDEHLSMDYAWLATTVA